MKRAIKEVIKSIKEEPQRWKQNEYLLTRDDGIEVWTRNIPYVNTKLYTPRIRCGLISRIRLQLAVNYWQNNTSINTLHR